MTEYEKGWLVGILEGEGSFFFTKGFVTIQLRMVDEDVVQEVAQLLDAKYHLVHPPSWQRRGWAAQYQMRFQGKKALELLTSLGPLFGERRQKQLRKLGAVV